MCDPISIGALALTTGGALVNRQQQNAAIEAQNAENLKAEQIAQAARRAEAGRQREMGDEQRQEVMDALPKVDPAKVAARAERKAKDSSVARVADQLKPEAVGINKEVATEVNRSTKVAREKIEAMAKLAALGQVSGAGSRALTEMGGDVATLGAKRRGSLNAGRLEWGIPPASVSPSDSPIGDLMIAGGTIAGGLGAREAAAAGAANPFDDAMAKLRSLWSTNPGATTAGPAFETSGRW